MVFLNLDRHNEPMEKKPTFHIRSHDRSALFVRNTCDGNL